MPKTKRDKKISLTKTQKKGLELKQRIVEDLRHCVEKYESIYLFTFKNMRNVNMKEVRDEWKPSRFFFGKNKVIGIGLGRTREEEVEEDLHKLTSCLTGQCALLFTDSKKEEVMEWFANYSCQDYARSGFVATATVKLEEGPLKNFSHAMEPHLRKLGLPTKLHKGVVTLLNDFEVCKEGSPLTPEQAKILELMKIKLAKFEFVLKAHFRKGEGFERVSKDSTEEDDAIE